MTTSLALKGIAMGLSIAAPVGPIGLLCIRRALSNGRLSGLVTGLGAATADAIYGCVAGFGLTAVSRLFIEHRLALGAIGGAFLCYLGIKIFFSPVTAETARTDSRANLWSDFLSTVFLTLTNPMTILTFAAIFAGFGVGVGTSYRETSIFVVGVFAGSALWWIFLSSLVTLFKKHVTPAWMLGINRVSGAVIVAFGLYSLGSTAQELLRSAR